jgi:hypothetical protein
VVARRKLGEWHETMSKLVPQILGLNLTKLARGTAQNRGVVLAT